MFKYLFFLCISFALNGMQNSANQETTFTFKKIVNGEPIYYKLGYNSNEVTITQFSTESTGARLKKSRSWEEFDSELRKHIETIINFGESTIKRKK